MTRADLDLIVLRLIDACDALDDVIAHASDPELMLVLSTQAEAIAARLQALSLDAVNTCDALVDSLTEQKVA